MLLMHSSRMIKHGTKVASSRAGHRSEMRQLRPRADAPSVLRREVSRMHGNGSCMHERNIWKPVVDMYSQACRSRQIEPVPIHIRIQKEQISSDNAMRYVLRLVEHHPWDVRALHLRVVSLFIGEICDSSSVSGVFVLKRSPSVISSAPAMPCCVSPFTFPKTRSFNATQCRIVTMQPMNPIMTSPTTTPTTM